jgi:signal transduction histidine kinase
LDFNVTETARQILISLMGKIDSKGLEVEFEGGDDDVFVLADPDTIHQVRYNLLDNAIKFTQEKGTISISITSKGKKALIKVRNTGEGIPEEELSHIFERFYKSDRSRGLDKTGTGLGLYIVKTILEKHGEEISVESVVGSYTEFRFGLSLSAGRPRSKNGDTID